VVNTESKNRAPRGGAMIYSPTRTTFSAGEIKIPQRERRERKRLRRGSNSKDIFS
jgi:hypothetical protein